MGTCVLNTKDAKGKVYKLKLENVLYVPNLNFNLVSVSRLDDLGHTHTSGGGKSVARNKEGEVVAVGR